LAAAMMAGGEGGATAFTLLDLAGVRLADAKFTRQPRRLSTSRSSSVDHYYLRIGQLADIVDEAIVVRVLAVLGRRDVLKVLDTVIEFVAVDVVDLHSGWRLAEEGAGHKSMDRFATVSNPHAGIPGVDDVDLSRSSVASTDDSAIGINEHAT
jgi:hypothetical protein